MNEKSNRPTKQALLDELNTYDTGFRDRQGNTLKLPTITSFLVFKKAIPSNDKLTPAMKPLQILKQSAANLCFDSDWVKSNLKQPLKSNYMFLGLNFAERDTYDLNPYSSFHTTESKSIKDNVKGFVLMNILTNDPLFEESYITDVLKNVAVTNSAKIHQRFFLDAKWKTLNTKTLDKLISSKTPLNNSDKLKIKNRLIDDKKIYLQSAKIFQHECELIQPKQLIAFGCGAQNAIKKMARDGLLTGKVAKLASECIKTYHYAAPLSVSHAMELKDELMDQIKQ